jgi:hypothetical protein
MTRPNLIRVGLGVLVLAILAALAWRFIDGRVDLDGDDAHPRAASSQTPEPEGDLAVPRDAQARSGIAVSVVQAGTTQDRTRAYATVLDPVRLTDLSNAEASARASLEAATAKAQASGQAYERAKLLYNDDQNMSLAQLQGAEATFRADQAAAAAARSQAQTARATEASELGETLSLDLQGGVGRSLIDRSALLVQITALPGADPAARPASAILETPNGGNVVARLIGVAPRVDPKLQAISYLYVVPTTSGLLPGMNLTALLPAGAPRHGALVPASSVVSWQGQSWVYERIDPDRFRRFALAGDTPMVGDNYLTDAIAPGAAVVVRGAQLLLSQELKPQAQGPADED